MSHDPDTASARAMEPGDRCATPLTVSAQPACGPALGHFAWGADEPVTTGALRTGQRWLGGDFRAEYWHAAPVVERSANGALAWSASGGLVMVSQARTLAPDTDARAATEAMYRELLTLLRARGYPYLLRVWNLIPQLNAGSGDAERYRRFCVGRDAALQATGLAPSDLGAATAVGSQGRQLLIHALGARHPGVAIENPRQVSAYRYPRAYGPSRPAFARALALPRSACGWALMVSGTASIVGHESQHPDDLSAQVEEMRCNVETLLRAAAEQLAAPGLAQLHRASLVRVYVRRAGDWPAVAAQLRAAWPGVPLAGLEAEICRRELLVEVEVFHPEAA